MTFVLTEKQEEARRLMAGPARHILLRGGSRSGKTFIICRQNVVRALKAPESSHVVLRARFNHLKASIIMDTMPKMVKLCFPELPSVDSMMNKTDWFIEFPNKSRIWYGGLDDKERTEKILGQEHSTITLNECSQISYSSRNKAITRLAQNVGLKLKAYYDCNPPRQGHWLYKLFQKKLEPDSGQALKNPAQFATMQMNPKDNPNLDASYIEILEGLPAKDRKRFLDGEYLPQVAGALWTPDLLDKHRVTKEQLPEMQRVSVNIDPSGASGTEDKRSDEIGITVTGLGVDKRGYLLEDASGLMSPEQWARLSGSLFDKWEADIIVAEKNFGGDMVRANIQAHRSSLPVKLVTASRGKTQRAEPVANLYEQGKISHLDVFPELEDQYCEFSSNGYGGERSPDRADSAIWGFTELMLEGSNDGMLSFYANVVADIKAKRKEVA